MFLSTLPSPHSHTRCHADNDVVSLLLLLSSSETGPEIVLAETGEGVDRP
jgi:hypothetical protein